MTTENDGWKKVKTPPRHFSRPLDPGTIRQMPPPGSDPFREVTITFGEFVIRKIMKNAEIVRGFIYKS